MLQPLINLSLASSWDTRHAGSAILCHCNLPTRHNTKTQQLSLLPSFLPSPLSLALFLPLSLSHHPPPLNSPPSSGHSRQYVSLTLANQRFTLDAQMEKKGKSKHWYMERGVWKKTFCISYYSVARVCIGRISIPLARSCILILLH